jgi:hypothetical protein
VVLERNAAATLFVFQVMPHAAITTTTIALEAIYAATKVAVEVERHAAMELVV